MSLAFQPADAKQFAFMQSEGHAFQNIRGKIVQLQLDLWLVLSLAGSLPAFPGNLGRFFTDHQGDDIFCADGFHEACANGHAITQNIVAVGNSEDLLHAVGDEDNGFTSLLPASDQLKETFHLAAVEAGGGLIQNEQARVKADRLEDFNDLFFIRGQGGDRNIRAQTGLDRCRRTAPTGLASAGRFPSYRASRGV